MKFGLGVIEVVGRQIIRSAVSVGANDRAACRAMSPADFIGEMGTVEEEADETSYRLDLLENRSLAKASVLKPLQREADELTAMVVASIRAAELHRPR